jgi:hypothetical protein
LPLNSIKNDVRAISGRKPKLGKLHDDEDITCREVDDKGLIVKMLDGELSREEEDALLFHLRNCPNCLAIVADVLFARSHFEERGKDHRINVN